MPYKTAFMSHAHADNAKCDPYADALKKRGIGLYYDRANPQVGHSLSKALEQEIQQAHALIVMVTPAALTSFWVDEEIEMFLTLMAQDRSRLLIPVKLELCQLPPRLASRWWIDATTLSMPQVADQLAKALEVAGPPIISTPAPSPSASSPVVEATQPKTSAPSSVSARPAVQPKAAPSPPITKSPQQAAPSPKPPVVSPPAPTDSPRARISRRTLIATGAVGVAAIGTGVIWWSRTLTSAGSPITAHVTPSPTRPLTSTPSPDALFVYRGHSDRVDSVAWSPKGTSIASASEDGTVHVWNATSYTDQFIYRNQSRGVVAVAWSPDGTRIASASFDNTVRVWNASDGGDEYVYHGHSDAVLCVAWSPDGTRIASGGDDFTVRVWEAVGGRTVNVYRGHSDIVESVTWSQDGTRVASASKDETVQVWYATGGHLFTYRDHLALVGGVAWSPDGKRVASAGWDATVRVWDPANGGHPLVIIGDFSDTGNTVAWSLSGTRIASGGLLTVHVWDATGHFLHDYAHEAIVSCVTWAPDGTRLASSGDDFTVRVWRAP